MQWGLLVDPESGLTMKFLSPTLGHFDTDFGLQYCIVYIKIATVVVLFNGELFLLNRLKKGNP